MSKVLETLVKLHRESGRAVRDAMRLGGLLMETDATPIVADRLVTGLLERRYDAIQEAITNVETATEETAPAIANDWGYGRVTREASLNGHNS